jgi:hypothetical protein
MLKYQKTKRQLKEEAQKLEPERARARADKEGGTMDSGAE